eukprot:maker-scaffold_9-augustus-gene-4.60-mRNA-1 protein AED:0.06 eAED:0.06 QI:0/0/0/0.75/0.33/0.25/4/0/544
MEEKEEIFQPIQGLADSDNTTTIIESLCMNCHKNGETRLLLTKVPFFKEIIVSSFYCNHCFYKSSEVQSAGEIQPKGAVLRLKMNKIEDFQRQVVKSESAVFRVEEIDFEIPAKVGKFSTIEGILTQSLEDLKDRINDLDYETLDEENKLHYSNLETFIKNFAVLISGVDIHNFPLTISIDDPSGNSFIENPLAPNPDPQMSKIEYVRSKQQNLSLGLAPENPEADFIQPKGSTLEKEDQTNVEKENLRIPSDCPAYKECGFRNNEVKGGGAIPPLGKTLTLKISKKEADVKQFEADMKRDVVKSTSAGIRIPEIELEVTHGSLGGVYTTVEGLLTMIYEKLFDSDFSELSTGDSVVKEKRSRFEEFQRKFDALRSGEMEFTVVVDDPLDNSFIYDFEDLNSVEPRLVHATYERTEEINDQFGLNDIDVGEGYTEQSDLKKDETLDKVAALQNDKKETHPDKGLVSMPEGYTDPVLHITACTIAFPLLTGSPDLNIPLPTNTPSTPNCIIRAASAGVATPPAAKFTTGSFPLSSCVANGFYNVS